MAGSSPVCMSLSAISVAAVIAIVFTVVFMAQAPSTNLGKYDRQYENQRGHSVNEVDPTYIPDEGTVPEVLFKHDVYNESDFRNPSGVVPAYWGEDGYGDGPRHSWGPCYWPPKSVHWKTEIAKFNDTHKPRYSNMIVNQKNHGAVNGLCRPGFLIIGAGKCGTSSLYHYLVDHPRVLPAKQKQIHYFLYYLKRYPLPWYLKFFPTTQSFLGAGALMTGEASPGYMPYPDIPNKIKTNMPGPPRIISIGRSPLERAYSSYKYNYKAPLLKYLRTGRVQGIQRRQPDEAYEQYIFSFEEMVRAELPVLRECLSPDGYGAPQARHAWGNKTWAKDEFKRRDELGLPPLIDLDNYCYGGRVNKTVPRRQWSQLLTDNPEKVITNENVHLTQSMIGRSLYVLPLEWWYFQYNKSDLYFICTEELDDLSGSSLHHLADFLGLPFFNFSETLSKGAYNVGVNSGYDKETTWSSDAAAGENKTIYTRVPTTLNDVPLSDEFMQELKEFFEPFNERLFELVGRRCNW